MTHWVLKGNGKTIIIMRDGKTAKEHNNFSNDSLQRLMSVSKLYGVEIESGTIIVFGYSNL